MLKSNIKEFAIKRAKCNEFYKEPFFYVYDSSDIDEKLKSLEPYIGDNVSLYYAVKANSQIDLLEYVKNKRSIKGIEIASVGELHMIKELFPFEKIIYTGPAKREYELTQSIINRIRFLSTESETELYRINTLAQKFGVAKVDVLVRINPNFEIRNSLKTMGGKSSKMGIDEDKISELLKRILSLENINIIGFHVFAASGILDYKNLIEYVEYIFKTIARIEIELGRKFRVIDFGGGIGVDYQGLGRKFDVKMFFQSLQEMVKKYHFEEKELVLELGRYLVAESGYYVAQIVDIKESKGKKHVILSGGVNHLRLIRKHPIEIISMNKPEIYSGQPVVDQEYVEIEGPLCFGEDIIDENIFLPHAAIGDLVVVSDVGAYGYNVASLEFLHHAKPKEYFI